MFLCEKHDLLIHTLINIIQLSFILWLAAPSGGWRGSLQLDHTWNMAAREDVWTLSCLFSDGTLTLKFNIKTTSRSVWVSASAFLPGELLSGFLLTRLLPLPHSGVRGQQTSWKQTDTWDEDVMTQSDFWRVPFVCLYLYFQASWGSTSVIFLNVWAFIVVKRLQEVSWQTWFH